MAERVAESRRRSTVRGQGGEILIETLLTVAILGITFVAFLSLLLTVTAASASSYRMTRAGNAATTIGENLERAAYQPCALTSNAVYGAALDAAAVDAASTYASSFTAAITKIEYLSVTGPSTTVASYGTSCTPSDYGIQRITIAVTSKGSPRAVLVFSKRDDRCSGYTTPTFLGQTC